MECFSSIISSSGCTFIFKVCKSCHPLFSSNALQILPWHLTEIYSGVIHQNLRLCRSFCIIGLSSLFFWSVSEDKSEKLIALFILKWFRMQSSFKIFCQVLQSKNVRMMFLGPSFLRYFLSPILKALVIVGMTSSLSFSFDASHRIINISSSVHSSASSGTPQNFKLFWSLIL